ncbi:MarR family winged helix-turn-helix transcriptional regulator [Streptomyces erythrochromogenes]|uniref:MarR family winged helix-turn-helix transcriptional regulator n=1 Tax=Streptomyces erythrochromogenes TaxID=285574 RepID=UPI0036736EE7
MPESPPLGSPRTWQDLLSRTALGVFRLNGQFLSLSEELARPAGLTAAWWQVLGAVLREPLPVAGIARSMGITRQSVQRIADLLVAKGLAEYAPNPAHRRAKLLRPTEEGRAAVDRIAPGHSAMAARLAAELGDTAFAETVRVLERLAAALDTLPAPRDPSDPSSPSGPWDASGPSA